MEFQERNSSGLDLRTALRADQAVRMAFVGAGGKTSAIFRLARQLQPPVLVSASTHLGAWQFSLADQQVSVRTAKDVWACVERISDVFLFTGSVGEDQRARGLDADVLQAVLDLANRLGCPLLLEADGSRQKPLKAPAEHEPALPEWAEQVVVTAGLSGLGQRLNDTAVHRVERFAELSGIAPGEEITPTGLVKVLTHPQGGLKGIPPAARKIVLLNQAEKASALAEGHAIVSELLQAYDAVVVGSVGTPEAVVRAVYEKTAGVVLAAGGSQRLGQPKALIPWRGKPLVRRAVENALAAGLSPVIVVLGAVNEPIRSALVGLPVEYIVNQDWAEGQSRSVKAGLAAVINTGVGAAMFLLADQPFISKELLEGLVDLHRRTLAPVIAPRVHGRRANPVLFDQLTFPHFGKLTGDTGGRAIFSQFPPVWLEWPDERLLFDVDTPEDLESLRGWE